MLLTLSNWQLQRPTVSESRQWNWEGAYRDHKALCQMEAFQVNGSGACATPVELPGGRKKVCNLLLKNTSDMHFKLLY